MPDRVHFDMTPEQLMERRRAGRERMRRRRFGKKKVPPFPLGCAIIAYESGMGLLRTAQLLSINSRRNWSRSTVWEHLFKAGIQIRHNNSKRKLTMPPNNATMKG